MKFRFKRIGLIALSVIGVISLTGCDFLAELFSQLTSEIGSIDQGGSDSGSTSIECEHIFDDGVPVDDTATCQHKGKVKFTCTLCGYNEIRNAFAPHTPLDAHKYQHDDEYHYQNCKWCDSVINKEEHHILEDIIVQYDCKHEGQCRYYCDVCDYEHIDVHPAEHYFPVDEHIDPTCQEEGFESYKPCPGCGTTKDSINIAKVPHEYVAETCIHCQRDIMLDYKEEFDAHGNDASDFVIIDSDQEMICLSNYCHLYRLKKYIKLNFDYGSNMRDYLFKIFDLCTDATVKRYFSFTTSGTGAIDYTVDDYDNFYLKKSGIDYEEDILEEIENPLDDLMLEKGNRSSSFDDFKIYDRKYSVNINNSDELFYASTHGYKPIANPGSKGETALNRVKDILRSIISDSMSDVEKLFNMYCWLTKNVQYDHGAVTVTDKGGLSNLDVMAWGVEGSIFEGKAICDSFSKTFAIFAAMENIKCIQVSGNQHAWNKVYLNLDGQYRWYVIDPTFANGSGEKESSSHDEFLFSDQFKKDNNSQECDNYLDCVASIDYNPFKLLKYDDSHDLFIENDEEFNHYISALSAKFKSYHNAGKTVAIEFAIRGEDSISSTTIRKAFRDYLDWNEASMKYSYTAHQGYFIYRYYR